MSVSSAELKGTYLGKLLDIHSDYTPDDFWALVCCGSDLNDPYAGWAGYVAIPVFSGEPEVELYFGEFPDSLAEYENVPDFYIRRSVSKLQAYDELRSCVSTLSQRPVFMSANAATWASKILQEADRHAATVGWEVSHLCIRDIFSVVSSDALLAKSGSSIGNAFALATPLPKRFGLNAIADRLDITAPFSSTKALYRARLLKQVAENLLMRPYPLQ